HRILQSHHARFHEADFQIRRNWRRRLLQGRQSDKVHGREDGVEQVLPLALSRDRRSVTGLVGELAGTDCRFCPGGYTPGKSELIVADPSARGGDDIAIVVSPLPRFPEVLVELDDLKTRPGES